MISVVIPVLNDLPALEALLPQLQALRDGGGQVIVVDGGSKDGTTAFLAGSRLLDLAETSLPGRAIQMNKGAELASGSLLWFLHADSQISAIHIERLQKLDASTPVWGRFNVQLSGTKWAFRMIEWFINTRSCLTGISTGDQGQFVQRDLFEQVGGFPAIPLMEDVAISKMLKAHAKPLCFPQRIITSSRRWEKKGIAKTVLLMWRLRFDFWRGVAPETLHKRYYQ